MKFWQYAVGVVLAILVFAISVVGDMTQYSERSTFSQNPFTLLGNQRAQFGGMLEFMETGEMVWLDDGVDLVTDKDVRRLNEGRVVVGGTFFPTSKHTAVTNQLWFGDVRLYSEFTTSLVDVSKDGVAKVLTGGGAVELYFGENEVPVIVPAHSQVEIPAEYVLERDPNTEYFVLREELKLQPLQDGKLKDELMAAEQVLAEWRAQFGHFAWNIPKLWAIPVGPVVQFLEGITLPLPGLKQARRDFQEEMQLLVGAYETENEKSMQSKLNKFRQRNLETSLLQRLLIRLPQEEKEWTWFEFAQKYWLPVVSPDALEQNFALLWKDSDAMENELMRSVALLSHNGKVLRADQQLEKLGEVIGEKEMHPAEAFHLSRLRRELTAVLDAFPIHRSVENFKLLRLISEKELGLLPQKAKVFVSTEIGHDVVRFVEPLINESNAREKVIELNSIWALLDFSFELSTVYSPDEIAVIEDIELVGVSGMTPAKVRLMKSQQKEQEALSEQLGEVQEEPEIVEEIEGITNAKKLWEFLAEQRIQLDITSFRTTRTETDLTTKFANTEAGTRRIAGVFDYNNKEFVTLTLGEETTENLPAHRLPRWIKLIGGKFDSGDGVVEEVVETPTSGISQNAPQAILARKLTQELLKGYGVELTRDDVEVISDDFQRTLTKDVVYENAKLTVEYSLLSREFSNMKLEKFGKVEQSDESVSADNMEEALGKLLEELRN